MPKLAQKPNTARNLTITLIIVILLAMYFLRDYFVLIALSAILAFLFNPTYQWLIKKTKNKQNLSAGLTFLTVILVVALPVSALIAITVDQAFQFVENLRTTTDNSGSFTDAMNRLILELNTQLDKVPGVGPELLNFEEITNWFRDNAANILNSAVSIASGFAGGFTAFITKAIIFIFVFLSMLRNQKVIINSLKKLNPLGEDVTDHYLAKMGSMTSAMVKGQFMIAVVQGLVGAILLRIVGFDYFVLWFVILTFLSIIPLGGGIIVLPIGAILLFTGNIWQGLVLILGHLLIVTNIDNVMRPRFVPKNAKLDSALLILSVFAGLSLFGFIGIVIGPVIMIVIFTTIQIYLEYLNPGSTELK